jgi:uncharacterized membrane protein YdjX (TVP38/TMEM64 family)
MAITLREIIILFLISFISNATPFFGTPYTIIAVTILIRIGVDLYSFIIGVVVTGLGASLSKTVMYAIGLILRRPLKQNKNMAFLAKFVQFKSFYVTLFTLALIPFFPFDDYLFLGAGVVKSSLTKLLYITTLAKILKSAIEMTLELTGIIAITRITRSFGITELEIGIISTVIFVILGYVLFKIDLEKYYNKIKTFFENLSNTLRSKINFNRVSFTI